MLKWLTTRWYIGVILEICFIPFAKIISLIEIPVLAASTGRNYKIKYGDLFLLLYALNNCQSGCINCLIIYKQVNPSCDFRLKSLS